RRTPGDDRRDVGHRLDVVDQYGWGDAVVGAGHLYLRRQTATRLRLRLSGHHFVDAAAVRRRDTGERRPAVDHLEQRCLLAIEVLPRAFDDADHDGAAPARGAGLGD